MTAVQLGPDTGIILPDGPWRERMDQALAYHCPSCDAPRRVLTMSWCAQPDRGSDPVHFGYRVEHKPSCTANRSLVEQSRSWV